MMGARPYYELNGFEHVYLEDSYFLGISETESGIEIDAEVVLKETHPLYFPPRPGEQYCYRKATIKFPNVNSVRWIRRSTIAYRDAHGEIDYGNFDIFTFDNGLSHLEGDWGVLELVSGIPTLQFNPSFVNG